MVTLKKTLASLVAAVALWSPALFAQDAGYKATSDEGEYYKILTFPVPDDVNLEVGAMDVLPNGKLVVSTRHGDIFIVEGAMENPLKDVKFVKWASGLHEVLGLAYRDGWLYAVQRGEVTRLKDTDGNGKADVYETYSDGWGISGDYHEYPIGSKFDKDGNLYVLLCLTGSFTSEAPFRGWCMKITPDGKAHPYASGIRSPGGMGFNEKGELFYCDNQGPWNGTSSMKILKQGVFEGHPIGNKWYSLPGVEQEMGPRPEDPHDKSRWHIEAKRLPKYSPPVILLPHVKVGQSSSGIACDLSDGKFGPFVHQMYVGDQHHSNLMRLSLDQVNGQYQGVAIPFRAGFASGIVPVIQAPDGSLFAGGTNRGWGSVGPREYALERVVWTGKVPFEIQDMKITPDGFNLTFTEPVDVTSAGNPASYDLETYTYIYREEYGSPEVDQTTARVKTASVSSDGKSVRLAVDGREIGHVHELHLPGIRSANGGKRLLHPMAYYTLWNIPEAGTK